MAVEEEVRPRRRVGVVQRLDRELPEEALRRRRATRGLERFPVRLPLHVARDHVVDGQREQVEAPRRRAAKAARGRVRHPAAAACDARSATLPAARRRVPGDALEEVVARVVGDLVREHRLHLVVREAAVEQRVPEDDPLAGPKPTAWRSGAGEVGHVLDAEWDRVDPCFVAYSRPAACRSVRSTAPSEVRYG